MEPVFIDSREFFQLSELCETTFCAKLPKCNPNYRKMSSMNNNKVVRMKAKGVLMKNLPELQRDRLTRQWMMT